MWVTGGKDHFVLANLPKLPQGLLKAGSRSAQTVQLVSDHISYHRH